MSATSKWVLEDYIGDVGIDYGLEMSSNEDLEGPEKTECLHGQAYKVNSDQVELYLMPHDNRLLLYLDSDADSINKQDQELFEYTAQVSESLELERIENWVERVCEDIYDEQEYAALD